MKLGVSARPDALVQNVVQRYFDELAETPELLNSRYDEMEAGKVKPIPGDEVVALFREKSAAARHGERMEGHLREQF